MYIENKLGIIILINQEGGEEMDLKSKQMKNALFLITFAIILMYLLESLPGLWGVIKRLFIIFIPFITGAAIAFIMNIPMSFIENTLFKRGKLKKIKDNNRRTISYFLTLIIFLCTIFIVSFIVIPELVSTIQDLTVKIPSYWSSLQVYVISKMADNPQFVEWINSINIDWSAIEKSLLNFLKTSALDWIGSGFSFASSVVSSIISFVLAFIFSIYLLFQKESLIRQFKKLFLAYLPQKLANKIFYIGNLSNHIFASFLSGQLLEALILGLLFLVPMSIFRFPYALMISILISITALIPMVGAFIGLAIGVFLILVVNTRMAFYFMIMFFIIQQIEGNLIYPHVVGKASGLPSIWILVAVTVGGSLMGVLGILLFIPISAVLYALLSESVNKRLNCKGIKM